MKNSRDRGRRWTRGLMVRPWASHFNIASVKGYISILPVCLVESWVFGKSRDYI
jgi:hypothetical protein